MTDDPTPPAPRVLLTVGSLFAGIGGFDLGFERAGFRVLWQVENDGKAQSVLSLRFPNTALHSDVRTANGLERVDVITGGFPCQDLSVAGRRGGLAGERSGLFWQIVRIARELNPRWMVLENVPGLLSSHGGRDFYAVLVALAECGFRRAYRILDSRYFGVPQRRRRVFIVLRAGGLGDGPGPVLFEPQSGDGDSQKSKAARADFTGPLGGGAYGTGRRTEDDPNLVTYAIGSHAGTADGDQTNRNHASGGPVGMNISREIAYSLRAGRPGRIAATLNSGGCQGGFRTEPGEHPIAATLQGSGHSAQPGPGSGIVAFALRADPGGTGQGHNTTYPGGVRRLTPLECERLQSFPDGWTCLCGKGHLGSSFCTCADSPRYRQLGNAVTVAVAEWIARRIAEVEI